jgi:hypothetical protein
MKRFQITFTVEATLDADALWPDGDAPENPTADDVRELIENEGGRVERLDPARRRRMKRFQITFTVEATLDADALWPDGDAPENPTADDVRELIENEGGILRVIDDWNLASPHASHAGYEVDEIAPRKPR